MPAESPMTPAEVTPSGLPGLSRRTFGAALAGAAGLAAGAAASAAPQEPGVPQAGGPGGPIQVPDGGLSEQELGDMLRALGLRPTKTKTRYDFQFKTTLEEEKWDFTMSAVLSRNGQSLWVMAWLDELPKQAAAVPRAALLKMLAANDRMGSGKFFAYIPANRRFVLQRVVANEGMSNRKLQGLLIDLGRSVRSEYGVWSVAGWSRAVGAAPQSAQAGPPQTPVSRISDSTSKFNGSSRN